MIQTNDLFVKCFPPCDHNKILFSINLLMLRHPSPSSVSHPTFVPYVSFSYASVCSWPIFASKPELQFFRLGANSEVYPSGWKINLLTALFRKVRASLDFCLNRFCIIALVWTKESIVYIVWPPLPVALFFLSVNPIMSITLWEIKYLIVPALPEKTFYDGTPRLEKLEKNAPLISKTTDPSSIETSEHQKIGASILRSWSSQYWCRSLKPGLRETSNSLASNKSENFNGFIERSPAGSGILVPQTVANIRNIEVSIVQTSVKECENICAKTYGNLSLPKCISKKFSVASFSAVSKKVWRFKSLGGRCRMRGLPCWGKTVALWINWFSR